MFLIASAAAALFPVQDEPEDYEWKPDMDSTRRALEDL